MQAPELTIRPLRPADLPAVMAIERRSFPTPWSLAMFVLELAKPASICIGAWQANPLAGYLVCARYADVWHLMNIAVEPARRRSGVARGLLAAMVERTGEQAPITLEVRTSNTPAIALYERFGFQAAGTRPRYYADTGEDALIMWRTGELAPAP